MLMSFKPLGDFVFNVTQGWWPCWQKHIDGLSPKPL